MRVSALLTCACLLLGGCLLGDADGEAPPPASSAQAAAAGINFNPAATAETGNRSNGPLLLPRELLEPPPEDEITPDYVFDDDAFVSRDIDIQAGTIDGTLGEREFAGPTEQNFGWYTSWNFDGEIQSYLTLEVATEGRAGAGMLILSFEGDLGPLRDQMSTASTVPREIPETIETWVVACYGASMYNWDADVPAMAADVRVSADPDDPEGVVFDVEATFDEEQDEPVHGAIWTTRGDLEAILDYRPEG